jgi:basic membrane protein A and related proteins
MKSFTRLAALLLAAVLLLPACGATPSNCKDPAMFCVGLVTNGGRVDDHGINQAAWEGVQQSKPWRATDWWIASIETVDPRDYEANIKVFADAGYDVIVTVGSDMGTATRSAAAVYPETYFIGVDQDQTGSQVFNPNLVGLIFPEDQIGFLAGALAGMLTQTGQVGAVCGSDELAPMKLYGDGFAAGVKYVNPNVQATVVYHNQVGIDKTLSDPAWGAATANTLVDEGVDILFGVGGTTGSNAIVAAAMRGAYGIGSETDEYYSLPVAAPRLYASVMKMITPDVLQLIKSAHDAQIQTSGFPTGNYIGQVGLSSYHDLSSAVPEEVKARLIQLKLDLAAGKLRTGVITTNP